MIFEEYDESRRRLAKDREHDANRVNDLAYQYIDMVFSCDAAGYSGFRSFRLARAEGFELRFTAHEVTLAAELEHVRLGDGVGGRWTFRRVGAPPGAAAVFAVDFDSEGRVRYGTRGPWTGQIERNPSQPWKSRDRLIANLAAAIQDGLARAEAG